MRPVKKIVVNGIPTISFLIVKILFGLLFILLISTELIAQQKNVSEILNDNGTIKSGVNGSFNASGYKLDYGKNGEPVLRKVDSQENTSSIATWSSLGLGRNGAEGPIYALAVNSLGEIYVGGSFSTIGDIIANNVAKWNGSSWSSLTSGSSNGVNNSVYALAVCGTDVYVGGSFTTLGDGTTSAKYIAKWDGSSWSTLTSGSSNGVNNSVYALAVSGTDVYVGGGFTALGDGTTSAKYIAKWNGSSWSTLTSGISNGVNNSVSALAVSGTDVYVGGGFTALGDGTSARFIAKWNGSSWSTLTSGISNGVNSYVNALAVSGTDVYVGGEFSALGDGTSANRIAKWNGSNWSTLTSGSSNGVNSYVYALAVSGTDVYVGGSFTTLGDGTSAIRIAKWNGSNWSTLTSGSSNGVNSYVSALAVSGTDVYVGGSFTTLGDGTSANRIAKWNGSSWSTLTSGGSNGVNSSVNALAVSGTDVYVGGFFTTLGDGTSAIRIAKWNGSNWSTLTSGSSNGVNNSVYALAVCGTDLYVGGSFTTLGDGTSANRIAKWNGTSWSTLTSGSSNGVNNSVYALAVCGTDVYVGGSFTTLGDGTTSAKYIAKWDGSSWSTLTSGSSNGVNKSVSALAVSGTDVYVGGSFTALGDGTSAKCIAKWNGSSWSALTSGSSNGVNSYVYALAVSGTDVYVGGNFTALGDGTSANRIAKWNGSNWSTLTSGSSNGVSSIVRALAISGTDVYVGGNFTALSDGTTSAKYIAKWNGSSWSTLTSGISNGVNSYVYALALNTNESRMYIGGVFAIAGGSTVAYCVAKFADSDNPLPVELASFTAASINASNGDPIVLLNWQTATEVNNYGFEVQRASSSTSPVQGWETLGFVPGHGNSNSPKSYEFIDTEAPAGKLQYRLKQIDADGSFEYYGTIAEINMNITGTEEEILPGEYSLAQNYPNPFNPSTAIRYQIPSVDALSSVEVLVTLKIYDTLGREVATLVNEQKAPGHYEVQFEGSRLASGIYLYKLQAGKYSSTKKLMLLK